MLNLTVNSSQMFFGGHGISRYDEVRYPIFKKLNETMLGFFWRPHSIDMSQERRGFESMSEAEQFVFTSNLQRQILLDSIQGRAPALTFLPLVSDPTLENCIVTWSFFETLHSESYTHILRAVYPDPSVVIEGIPKIKEIADCATSIKSAYERCIDNPSKENLYLALVSANALEGIRFYVSFACTFSFMDRGICEGSGKDIRYIARDEAQHLALTNHIIRLLPTDDPEFVEIIQDNRHNAIALFEEAAAQEQDWARYIFSKGSVLGLNENILNQFVEYQKLKCLRNLNLSDAKMDNPLGWMNKYLNTSNVQVAPQEVEVASYVSQGVKNDVGALNLKNIWDSL